MAPLAAILLAASLLLLVAVVLLRLRATLQSRADALQTLIAQLEHQTQALFPTRKPTQPHTAAATDATTRALTSHPLLIKPSLSTSTTTSTHSTAAAAADAQRVASLQARVTTLSGSVAQLTTHRDAAQAAAKAAEQRTADLARQLAQAHARCQALEDRVTQSDVARLELLSKLQAEAGQRTAAVDRLRRPLRALLDERDDKMEEAAVHDVDKGVYDRSAGVSRFVPVVSTAAAAQRGRATSFMPITPTTQEAAQCGIGHDDVGNDQGDTLMPPFVARSPSDSAILSMNPDLSPSSSSSSIDTPPTISPSPPHSPPLTATAAFIPSPNTRIAAPITSTSPSAPISIRTRDIGGQTTARVVVDSLQLDRAPWADALHPDWRQSVTYAAAGGRVDADGTGRRHATLHGHVQDVTMSAVGIATAAVNQDVAGNGGGIIAFAPGITHRRGGPGRDGDGDGDGD